MQRAERRRRHPALCIDAQHFYIIDGAVGCAIGCTRRTTDSAMCKSDYNLDLDAAATGTTTILTSMQQPRAQTLMRWPSRAKRHILLARGGHRGHEQRTGHDRAAAWSTRAGLERGQHDALDSDAVAATSKTTHFTCTWRPPRAQTRTELKLRRSTRVGGGHCVADDTLDWLVATTAAFLTR